MPSSDARFYQRVVAVAGIAVVVMLLYQVLEPFLGPIAWALFLGFLRQPMWAGSQLSASSGSSWARS